MTKYQDKLSGFAERLKNEENLAPIQEIKPIGESLKLPKREVQLNIWIPKSLMKKINQKTLDSDISIKDWVTEAIINQLTKINNL
jgi:hypothetical protein